MTLESLEKAKRIVANIESAKRRIESFERAYKAGEGKLVICTGEKLTGGHSNIDSIYLSDDMLEVVKNAYINHFESLIEKQRKEFESL